jgi:hypothetical protein
MPVFLILLHVPITLGAEPLHGSARHVGAVVSLSSLTDLNGQQGMGYCSFKGAQQKTTFLEKKLVANFYHFTGA